MPITQAILCIILAVGVLTIFFLAGTIIGGLHAYSKAYTEVEEAHSNILKKSIVYIFFLIILIPMNLQKFLVKILTKNLKKQSKFLNV